MRLITQQTAQAAATSGGGVSGPPKALAAAAPTLWTARPPVTLKLQSTWKLEFERHFALLRRGAGGRSGRGHKGGKGRLVSGGSTGEGAAFDVGRVIEGRKRFALGIFLQSALTTLEAPLEELLLQAKLSESQVGRCCLVLCC